MTLSLIAAASENNVIGKGGTLPWHLPDDMKFFRDKTRGHPVIMGRKTFESLKSPLPNRPNIVITRNADLQIPGCTVVSSLEDAIDAAKNDSSGEIFVIGGTSVFAEALPHAHRIYLTRVHTTLEGDAFFPDIHEEEWKEVSHEDHPADADHQYPFTFLTYERRPL